MKLIDLYAGIGGFRLALENLGGECVLSAERDKKCRETYSLNFTIDHPYADDVAELATTPQNVPEFDFLTAGFPCQPFSSFGKRNGLDHESGNCFFDLCKIIKHCRPSYFLFENVTGLVSNDNRQTFKTIMKTLELDLGYSVFWQILSSYPWVPQVRRRIYIIGIKRPTFAYQFPEPPYDRKPIIRDILEKNIPDEAYLTAKNIRNYHKKLAKHPRWCPPEFTENDVCYTFVSEYRKTHNRRLLFKEGNGRLRVFTPREVARCMGFPEWFQFPDYMSNIQKYKQLGNSVVVPVIEAIAEQLFDS